VHAVLWKVKGKAMKTMSQMKEYAKRMRDEPTPSEKEFFRRLRSAGIACLRQKIMGFGIVDFYFPRLLLAVEIDGEKHKNANQRWRDNQRDILFSKFGIETIRIQNQDVECFDLSTITNRPIQHESLNRRAMIALSQCRLAVVREQRRAAEHEIR